MGAKFEFYEVVKIEPHTKEAEHLRGCEGAVLGKSEENGRWWYAVAILDLETTRMFSEEELVATGKMKTRADFYDGSSITVVVDPETGEGDIKQED